MEKAFYLIHVIRQVNIITGMLFGIFVVVAILTTIGYITCKADHEHDNANLCKKWAKRSFIIVCISAVLRILIPSKDMAVLMIGGHVVDSAIEKKPEISELPENTLVLINDYIKEATVKVAEKNKRIYGEDK